MKIQAILEDMAGRPPKPPDEKNVSVGYRLPRPLADQIRAGAAARGITVAAFLALAVRAYLDAQNQPLDRG